MASLENLPADQRAVLQLVLQRGRSYDQIAELLSIDRAGVRQRALEAFDELGPHTRVPPERRALITDYLLGQLPSQVSEDTRDRLAESPAERAWARVIASELTPLAARPLPEIPVEAARKPDSSAAAAAEPLETPPARDPADAEPPPQRDRPSERRRSRGPEAPGAAAGRSSRRGGAIILGVLAVAVVAVVVVLIASGGGSSKHSSSTVASTSAASSTSATTASSTTSSTTPQIIAQVNLTSPSAGSKTVGIARVVKSSTTTGILIAAQDVPANTQHDAYAVWLYNSPTDSHILGFVNPGVGNNGRLSTAGALPANAGHFKQLLVTLETQRTPTKPGKIILQGTLTGLS